MRRVEEEGGAVWDDEVHALGVACKALGALGYIPLAMSDKCDLVV